MINLAKLRQEKKKKQDSMRALCEAGAKRDNKTMTETEREEYDKLRAEVETINAEIETGERSNDLELEEARSNENTDPEGNETREEKPDANSFGSLGEFLLAVRNAADPGSSIDNRLVPDETRAAQGQNTTVPSDGGFLVQTDHMTGIVKRAYDLSVLAGRTNRMQIGANANSLTWNELKEDSRVAGSRNGGIRGYWAAQATTVTKSQAEFRKRRLDLEKLMALVYMTEETLQDTVAMDSLITDLVSDEFAFLLDEAIFEGSGAGIPLGIMNSDALISVAKESGQAAATIVYENISKMRARLWARSRQNSVWYINQDAEPELQSMALVVGTGGVPVYMPASGAAGSPYDTLFGRPVIPIEHAETVGTKGDIVLADLSQYRIVDKGGIKKAVSMHVRFLYDEQVFRFTYRVNGGPLWSNALTPKNGSNTQSPFVTLAARA